MFTCSGHCCFPFLSTAQNTAHSNHLPLIVIFASFDKGIDSDQLRRVDYPPSTNIKGYVGHAFDFSLAIQRTEEDKVAALHLFKVEGQLTAAMDLLAGIAGQDQTV